jgi:ribosomal protein S4
MALDDDEIERSRVEEQSRTGAAKREAAERKREHLKLARELDRAMKARDERGFSAALRRAGILDGSPHWINAWKAYHAYWS